MQNLSCAWIARFHDGLESNHFISKTGFEKKGRKISTHYIYICLEIGLGSRVWRDCCFAASSMAAAVWECHVTYSDEIPRGEILNMIRWSPCAMQQNQICTHVSRLPT